MVIPSHFMRCANISHGDKQVENEIINVITRRGKMCTVFLTLLLHFMGSCSFDFTGNVFK